MEQTSNEKAWWGKTRTLMWSALAIWAIFSFAIHFFAPSLNGITIAGFPLGFYMAAQGSIAVFVILCFWFASAQDKIDAAYGVAEDE